MKKLASYRFLFAVAAVVMTAASGGCQTGGSATASDRAKTAVEFTRAVMEKRFADAVRHFAPVMAQAMTADQLKQAWQSVITQCGATKRIGHTRTSSEAGYDIVFVPCEFEKATLDIKLLFDGSGRINGLWFVPHVEAEQAVYSEPPYVQRDRFEECDMTVVSGKWHLPGTLTVPKGDSPFPAVVLVHGSGPNDRDESVGANKPFRDIARGLASKRIAVLRYDKRTKVYGAAASDDPARLTAKDEVTDDALAAIKLLRSTPGIDPKRVFVLGHSLGAMLAPRIGKADKDLAGLIVIAGATRSLEDLVVDQMEYLASLGGKQSEQAEKQLAEVRRQAAAVKNVKPGSAPLLGVPASYWLDVRGYNPAVAAKSLKQPMLIVQGGRDYQVTVREYEGWKKTLAGRPDVTFKLYTTLNHLLMDGTGKSQPAEYDKRGPVSEQVIDDLAGWIKSH